jgi:hypothetical protein
MSLKAFHLVFIAVSIALSAFVAAWGLREWSATRSGTALALSVVFFASGVALVGYGMHVVRKLRDL